MAAICRREILVRGKPTEFLSLGASLNENPKKILLIIPGNPGVTSYYRDFMQSLYSGVSDTHSVWAISHAGHSHTASLAFWPDSRHVYALEDQIQHKRAFIQDYIPKDAEVTLIGHSIGSYIILRVLKAFEDNAEININKNYLLFPTFERMKTTPNGKMLWPLFCYFRWLAVILAIFATLLPVALKRMLISICFRGRVISDSCLQATVELLHPKIIQNVLWMAYNELSFLGGADIDIIEKHKSKLVFYYGAKDGWCPQSYRNELLQRVDGLDSHLCEDGLPHAFVLGKAEVMAKKVVAWVKP